MLKSTWSVASANRALFEDGFETAGLLGNYVKSYDETVNPYFTPNQRFQVSLVASFQVSLVANIFIATGSGGIAEGRALVDQVFSFALSVGPESISRATRLRLTFRGRGCSSSAVVPRACYRGK